jgi:hypothetical protein
MKLKLTTLLAVLLACTGYSQTNTPADSSWFQLARGASDAGQITVAVYPGYAPGLLVDTGEFELKKKEWGMGMALLYPVGDFVLVGGRLDYMADEFWMPSVTLGLKADIKLFNKLIVTPFTIGGAIMPLSGAGEANHDVGAIVGGGIYSTVWNWHDSKGVSKGGLQVFYAAEYWSLWDGVIIHRPGVAFTVRF